MLVKDGKDRVALVTGSTGYIGGQLIIELLKNGWAVTYDMHFKKISERHI